MRMIKFYFLNYTKNYEAISKEANKLRKASSTYIKKLEDNSAKNLSKKFLEEVSNINLKLFKIHK